MTDLVIPKIWEGKEICICVTDERAVFVYNKEQDKFIDTGKNAIELPQHGRLIDADALPIKDEWSLVGTDAIWNAPTVLERTT